MSLSRSRAGFDPIAVSRGFVAERNHAHSLRQRARENNYWNEHAAIDRTRHLRRRLQRIHEIL